MGKTAIVTPIGNESGSILAFFLSLRELGENILWIPVTDKYSIKDNSDKIASRLEITYPGQIIHVHVDDQVGVGGAYRAGLDFVKRNIQNLGIEKIVEVDIGHPVDKIPLFIKHLDKYSVVMGTRYKSGGGFVDTPFKRRMVSKIGTLMSRRILGLPFSDCTSGFQGMTVNTLKNLDLDNFRSTGHFYQTEFKFYVQLLSFAEVPFLYDGSGNSSLKIKAIMESWTIFWSLMSEVNITKILTEDKK